MIERLKPWLIQLRWPMLVLGAALVIGGAIVLASLYVAHRKSLEHTQAMNRLKAVELALANLKREERDLIEYRQRYEALVARGLFGDERRLAWVEQARALSESGVVASLEYDLAQQRSLALGGRPESRSLEALASQVSIKAGLLHEGRFIAFLEAVRRSPAGSFRVENCTLRRSERSLEATSPENLLAECRFDWITLKTRGGGPT